MLATVHSVDQGTRRCPGCADEKPRSDFLVRKPWLCSPCRSSYKKLEYQRTKEACKARARKWEKANADKSRELHRVMAAKRRRDAQELKTDPCMDCENVYPPECMDWDHLDDKHSCIALMTSCNKDVLLSEISKCELVCSNCHRIRTQRVIDNDVNKNLSMTAVAQWQRKHKRKLIEWYRDLRRDPCTDCQNSYDPVCMDFDHVDTTSKYKAVSVMVQRCFSRKRILVEIQKCELVCSNCHRIRTHKGRQS
jgi:hypothetical protein